MHSRLESLERERGITIFSKNCAIDYTDRHGQRFHINIVDTPGHADFSGEVERVLKMADGVLLLVDAFEGVMPQTRYVLSKALATGLRPVVVINKMDRPEARPHEVLTEVFDLLVELGADDHPRLSHGVYLCPRGLGHHGARPAPVHWHYPCGFRRYHPAHPGATTRGHGSSAGAHYDFRLQRLRRAYRYWTSVFAGTLRSGQDVTVIDRHGQRTKQRIGQLLRFVGLGRQAVDHIDVGDLFAVVGLEQVEIGDTLTDLLQPAALPSVPVDEPTLHMTFRINDGPFTGREGTYVTSRQIRERLGRELQSNVALRVEEQEDGFIVSGRGLLHLGILLENMRREGYELLVGKPEVIYHYDGDTRLEPIELLVIDVPTESVGAVMQLVGERRGELHKMDSRDTRTHMEFSIPARGLIGLRSRLLTATQGEAIMHHRFHAYGLFRGQMSRRSNGVMIATETGQALPTPLTNSLTAAPCSSPQEKNLRRPGRRRALQGWRHSSKRRPTQSPHKRALFHQGTTVTLKVPRKLPLEAALEYIEQDEFVELTPQSIRLRKRWLHEADRRRQARRLAATVP